MSETRRIQIPAESLPVLAEADVVVIGGGTSGFIAATAAARSGAKTILIERLNYLGGCTTTTYNTSIGLFFDADGEQIVRGLAWEFLERMQREGEAFGLDKPSPQIWPPTTKKIALDMITEAGVDLHFYTWCSAVIKQGSFIQGIVVLNKSGRGVILGNTFVDASGDADAACWAGAPFEMAPLDELQQVSVDFTACGVDAARVIAWAEANQDKLINVSNLQHPHQEYGAQPMFSFVIPTEQSRIDPDGYFSHTGIMPTVKLCVYREAVRLQGNVDINPLDPKALTEAEVKGMRGAQQHLQFLRDNIPGFEGAFIVAQNHLGVRESRRIMGDYVLTIEDLENQARFADRIALNCRALDYHLKGTLFKVKFLAGHHDIPLRALLPQNVENLLIAGRCISCDHLAQASLRGAATCMATGHAAGVAAALAAKGDGRTRAVEIKQAQELLVSQGAIL